MCFDTERNLAILFREFVGRINVSYIQSQENHENKTKFKKNNKLKKENKIIINNM